MQHSFCFEFHSFLPVSVARTYNEALSNRTVQLFGRASSGESVCLGVIGVCPYFYVQIDDDSTDISANLFGGEERLNAAGLNSSQFFLSTTSKQAFYQFQTRSGTFVKVECCNEGVRKRFLDFLKTASDLNLNLFEGHISFALQFMSDYGIVGMGNVILDGYTRPANEEITSNCDLELIAHHSNIINESFSQQSQSSNRPLLSTLSVFLDSLGVNNLPQSTALRKDSKKLDYGSIYNLWGKTEVTGQERHCIRITDPNFKNYTFRYPPPLVDSDFSLQTQPIVKQCADLRKRNNRSSHIFHYTPSIDPPTLESSSRNEIVAGVSKFEDVIERLSLNTKSPISNPLYNFNGEYFLKIMAIETFTCPSDGSILAIGAAVIFRDIVKVHILKLDSLVSNLKPKSCDSLLSFFAERDLIQGFIDLLLTEDPDVLSGFDVDNSSWGLLARRYGSIFSESIFESVISRLKSKKRVNLDPWLAKASSQFQVPGRIVINLWRVYRDEVALRLYTAADVSKHFFNTFCPEYDSRVLSDLIGSSPFEFLKHCSQKVRQTADLTFRTPFLIKAIEFSRLFGIDLFSTLTRGSQYRVESIMIRAAHTEGFLLRTPRESDVNGMRAAQGLPLVMEPESRMYRDPVVVLDFQSLYPSLVIAYNYCYSTVIGSMHEDGEVRTCGFIHNPSLSEYGIGSKDELFSFDLFEAPENILFVQKSVKVGLLPRLLEQILQARLVIKGAMKSCDPRLRSVMDARQLALKYISNVTYGYTSASFSGRMPNVDIADAIVLSGRKTLERAVNLIESMPQWAAKVVYGDTDSLFILLPGRSREEAFRLGREMADAVTAMNPRPVTLKFEKVYHPCVLMTKKRYCGYKFESETSAPVFDAKGIETVRRDGCPLAAKILEKSLRLLFTGHDLEFIKAYIQRQMVKILSYKKLHLADFVFAREVRFGSYKSEQDSRLPLSAIAAKQAQARDPLLMIPYGQRVPFIIVSRPFSKLYQQVLELGEFIRASPQQRIDVVYYVTKQIIPVLSRSLLIEGVDVFKWYNELPLSVLRHACHSNKAISIFGGSIVESSSSSLHQQALLLQDLLATEEYLRQAHARSCRRLEGCQARCCQAFWNQFSFQHLHGQLIDALSKQFFK